ncbi:terminase small subunit [uncultured Rikenella sp.]|uniref:terminase small subunit n=1 Tax=uncultured Rikenella sp. TaxID=368003 RepID=UPI0026047DF4|nr:terminase small subunit [uncultured Rikenella sp.]
MARTTKRKRIGQPRQRICTLRELRARCDGYFRMVDSTPRVIWRTVINSGERAKIPVPIFRPYRVIDLCAFIGCSVAHLRRAVDRVDADTGDAYDLVLARAKMTIEAQNEAGAMMRIFSASPAARRRNAERLNEAKRAKRAAAEALKNENEKQQPGDGTR